MTVSSGTNADFARGFELLKRTYADKVEDLVPESDRLAKDIPFIAADKQPGQDYVMPVTLNRESGVTFWNDGSVKILNMPLAAGEVSASIRGSEIAVRSALSYKFMHSALKSLDGTRAGARAFVNATKDRFEKLTKGASFFREAMLLYGGGTTASANLGVISATTGSATTNLVAILTAGEFAEALWSGSEGAEYDIYAPNGTKRNTAGTGSTTVFKLASNNATNYSLNFTSDAANVTAVQPGDQIFFIGARGNDALGFVGAANTQAGNLWGINTGTYGAWKPRLVNVAGALTFPMVMDTAAGIAGTGFYGDYDLYVNPATFQDICNDQTALVTHTTRTTGKVSIGFDDVSFRSQAGAINLKPHPYLKRGIALGLPRDTCMRVGASDLTHTMPGYGKMFRELENAAGVEMRLWTDQAPFCKNPRAVTLFTGIQNTTD